MDGEVVIKAEPLDWDTNDNFNEYDCHMERMHSCGQNQEVQGYLQQVTQTKRNMQSQDDFQYKDLTINSDNVLSSDVSENIITVNIAEAVKTEDEILFIKQMLEVEEINSNHDPALIIPTDLEMYAKEMKDAKIMTNVKSEEGRPLHKCRKNCDKAFHTLTERALHETHDHKISTRHAKCNLCNESFENFFVLSRHMVEHRSHHSTQRYVCACSWKCYSYEELKKHWKTHEQSICSSEVKREPKTNWAKDTEKHDLYAEQSTDEKSSCTTTAPLQAETYSSSSLTAQPLSFEEEIKAFTAKYKFKTVAKKRTSAMICKPVFNGGKKQKGIEYEIEPVYAVPRVANSSYMHFLQNVKIKAEPVDEEYETTTTNVLGADPIIKNEPHDDDDDDYKNNGSYCQNVNESEEKATTNPTLVEELKTKVENVPTHSATVGADILPHKKILLSKANLLSMKNVKIFKLGPLGKTLQFSPPPSVKSQTQDEVELKEKPQKIQSTDDVLSDSNADIQAAKLKKEMLMASITKLSKNTKVFQNEKANALLTAIDKGGVLKRKLPRWLIRYMEEQPENKKIIEDLQRQFQNANEEMKTEENINKLPLPSEETLPLAVIKLEPKEDTTTPPTPPLSTIVDVSTPPNVVVPPAIPESFFLKVADFSDKELMIARLQYPDYYYAWICHMCHKEYTQKHAFISHLVGTHKLSNDDLKTLTVEVRPFLTQNVKPEQNLSTSFIKKREDNREEKSVIACNTTTKAVPVKPQYQCDKCKRSYCTRQSLLDHCNTDCGRIPVFLCAVCSKSFASSSTLKCHMSIHTGELRYKCKYCEKRFRTNGQVRVHQRKHTGEKPFKCQICTLAFTHRETLISHLSRHMDIKRYICNGCDKRFSTISALTTHRNVRKTSCGLFELDTQAVGPLIRVTQGQIRFEPQRVNHNRTRRKICQEILSEIQNIPKKEPLHHDHFEQRVQEENLTLN